MVLLGSHTRIVPGRWGLWCHWSLLDHRSWGRMLVSERECREELLAMLLIKEGHEWASNAEISRRGWGRAAIACYFLINKSHLGRLLGHTIWEARFIWLLPVPAESHISTQGLNVAPCWASKHRAVLEQWKTQHIHLVSNKDWLCCPLSLCVLWGPQRNRQCFRERNKKSPSILQVSWSQ